MINYVLLRQHFDALAALDLEAQEHELTTLSLKDAELAKELRELLHPQAAHPGTGEMLVGLQKDFEHNDAAYWLGKKIGSFQIRRLLGTGGMAQVFLAERTQGDVCQSVALKLNHYLAHIGRQRFLAESKILAALKHANIAHFIESGLSDEGISYVAMEYVDGKDITEYARLHQLSVIDRLKLIQQVLSAVSYAHQHLIVHRDIKPDNVYVDHAGNVKLLDFGIAKLIGENQSVTASADRSYTRLYAAPEQITGDAAGVHTDIYAVAQLCYELLTGAPPFQSYANAPGQLESAIMAIPPAALETARKSQSSSLLATMARSRVAELDSILQFALRKERESRYGSADKFAEDLTAFIESRPVKAKASTGFYRVSKFIARHRAASVVATVSTLLLLLSATSIVLQNKTIRAERDRAEATLKVFNEAIAASDPAGQEAGRNSIRDVLAHALDSAALLKRQQPNTYLSIASNIGQMQYDIGEYEEAYQTAESLLALAQESSQRRFAYGLLFRAMMSTSRNIEALKKYEEIAAQGFANDPTILTSYAQLQRTQGNPLLAKQLLERALANSTKTALDYQWTWAALQLANTYRALDDPKKAVEILDMAVENLKELFPADHTYIIRARLHRAHQLRIMKLFEPAKAEGVALIATATSKFGVNSAFYGRSCASYASTLVEAGLYSEALPYFEKALTAYEQSLGLLSRNTIEARFNLAQFESYLFRKPALERFEQSVRDAERAQFFRLALFFRSNYADQLSRQEHYARAFQVLFEGLRIEHVNNSPEEDKREIARQGLELLQKGACGAPVATWSAGCEISQDCKAITEICDLKASKELIGYFN